MSDSEFLSYPIILSRDGNWTKAENDLTGVTYEEIVRDIFEAILAQDTVKTIEIERHVLLKGRAAQHEVDVFWRFEAGGIEYRTIMQVKDWSSKVKQGHLLQFKGVLDDLPGQVRGVFVARSGYQRGAKSFAQSNGIRLFELTRMPSRLNRAWR